MKRKIEYIILYILLTDWIFIWAVLVTSYLDITLTQEKWW